MAEAPNYYAIIPAVVRYDSDLSSTAKLLYGEITSLCSKTGECWASNDYFANLYNCSSRSIRRFLAQLIEKKYISVKFIYKNQSKEIEKRTIYISGDNVDSTYGNNCPHPQDKIGQMCEDTDVLDNNTSNINNTSINNTPIIPISPRRCMTNNEWKLQFDIFWKLYPIKQKKSSVRLWFEKNKINDETFDLIIEKLKIFKKTKSWNKNDGEFIPHPSTFLNQKRWEDEIKKSEILETEEERGRRLDAEIANKKADGKW